jgi:hypothetical protein
MQERQLDKDNAQCQLPPSKRLALDKMLEAAAAANSYPF